MNDNSSEGRDHRTYAFEVDDTTHETHDPVVTGQQILEIAQKFPTVDYLIYEHLQNGQLEGIRLDETADLRHPGRERFITFKSDRAFTFTLDGRRFEWGLPFITGMQLKRLAGVDPASYGVWLAQRIGDDRLIGNTERVNLEEPGVERFFTGIDTTTEGSPVILPAEDRAYLHEQGIAFEEFDEGGAKAVIFKARNLPTDRFDTQSVDILILLPPAYPDAAPDMFYLTPWVRLASNNQYPKAADQPYGFLGLNWQRWSRHNNEWRPGVDGIWTMIRRIERALEIAA